MLIASPSWTDGITLCDTEQFGGVDDADMPNSIAYQALGLCCCVSA